MPICKSGASRLCMGFIEHNHWDGLCSNCADVRDRSSKKKNDLTNEEPEKHNTIREEMSGSMADRYDRQNIDIDRY